MQTWIHRGIFFWCNLYAFDDDFHRRKATDAWLQFNVFWCPAVVWCWMLDCFLSIDAWNGVTSCYGHSFTSDTKAPLSKRTRCRRRPPRYHLHNPKSSKVKESFKIFHGKWRTSAEMTTCELLSHSISCAFTFQVPSESQVGGMLR